MYKNSKYTVLFPLLLAAGVVLGLLLGQYMGRNSTTSEIKGMLRQMALPTNKLTYTLSLIENQYVDSVAMDSLAEHVIPLLVKELDPHSVYIPAAEMQQLNEPLEGEFDGIGVVFNMATDTVIVLNVIPQGPSDKAGIKAGDRIIEINDTLVAGQKLPQRDVVKKLRGPRGTTVHLGLGRQGITDLVGVDVVRDKIPIKSVESAFCIADGIGYIRHSDFTEGCYEDMRAAVEKLRTGGELKGLILDYRSNGGGIMQEAVKILGMFVPKGTEVVSTKGRTEDSRRVYRTESEPILPDLPLAVLVNGNSASASEIVTGALQDLDRAVIIGQRSYGKGLVQTPRPLGYNAMLKLTTAKYYIPSGRCIQAIDYSHSQEGSVKAIPDSLITEYRTRAGRKVYDGGGIMPDIRTEPEYISRFAMTLYALGFIEDFGDEYVRRHPGQQIDIRTFSITDGDYAEFAEFMKDKEVPYESDTRRALKKLREAAKTDRFEEVEQQIAAIDSTLRDDTATNLETYRKEIVETINNDIVMRHGYSEGVIEHSLKDDPEGLRATEILGDGAAYTRIVTEQDTPRK